MKEPEPNSKEFGVKGIVEEVIEFEMNLWSNSCSLLFNDRNKFWQRVVELLRKLWVRRLSHPLNQRSVCQRHHIFIIKIIKGRLQGLDPMLIAKGYQCFKFGSKETGAFSETQNNQFIFMQSYYQILFVTTGKDRKFDLDGSHDGLVWILICRRLTGSILELIPGDATTEKLYKLLYCLTTVHQCCWEMR